MTEHPPPRRVLVTGAAGFIGFHVAARLARDGFETVGIDNLDPYYDVRLKEARLGELAGLERFRFVRLDITDAAGVAELFSQVRPDAVVHLAAQAGVRYSIENPRAYVSANVDGFLSILEACRATAPRHLVYASSSSVYGQNAKLPFSEHDPADHPISLYAATKRANELMAHVYCHVHGLAATGLRFFTVYGPWGRPDMAYFKFVDAIENGRPIEVYDAAAMSRDFTYVDDIVEAIVRLIALRPSADPHFDRARPDPATAAVAHRVYNIGNHTPVTLDRFIAVIEEALGKAAIRRPMPRPPGDVPATYAAVDDLSAAVGFAPRTSIEDGIARFVAWYRGYRAR